MSCPNVVAIALLTGGEGGLLSLVQKGEPHHVGEHNGGETTARGHGPGAVGGKLIPPIPKLGLNRRHGKEYVVLFGGQNNSGTDLSDTWTFVGNVWTES